MDYRVVDMGAYPRKEHFAYFRSLAFPYVGVTRNVDITAFLRRCKAQGHNFFLRFLYEVAAAANAVPALRQRILGEQIIEFPCCKTSHTVMRPDGVFAYCTLDCHMPLEQFLPYAAQAQEAAKAGGGISDPAESIGYFFISCLPWLSYSALIQPVPMPADSNPRITWGKYETHGQDTILPVSILAHHGLVDGKHIAEFYQQLEERLP